MVSHPNQNQNVTSNVKLREKGFNRLKSKLLEMLKQDYESLSAELEAEIRILTETFKNDDTPMRSRYHDAVVEYKRTEAKLDYNYRLYSILESISYKDVYNPDTVLETFEPLK